MTLRVPFEQFPATVKRLVGSQEAYVSSGSPGVIVSASNPKTSTLVLTSLAGSLENAKEKLTEAGMTVYEGSWSEGETHADGHGMHSVYIGAVAYASGDERPGVWLDAYATLPTPIQVLRAMYDELIDTGELADVAFEEFVRLSNANVVIVSPEELAGYMSDKDC